MESINGPHQIQVEPKLEVDRSAFPEELGQAIDHAHGGDDPVAHPAALSAAQSFMLPKGNHFGLQIEHSLLESKLSFTGGGNKWVWHITVSPWNTVDSMLKVLKGKNAAPHLIIGGRAGVKRPVVIQIIPFNQAGRALVHLGGPETNRADAIQTEICATEKEVSSFPENHYRALANLVRLTNLTLPSSHDVPQRLARDFANKTRFGGQEFVDASGHCGHMHVPGNTHRDPTTHFRGRHIMDLLANMPDGGYVL